MTDKSAINDRLKLGILGGGQLGKMLIQAASKWDIHCAILDPTPDCPAATYANSHSVGKFSDYDEVMKFVVEFAQKATRRACSKLAVLDLLEHMLMNRKIHFEPIVDLTPTDLKYQCQDNR